MKTLSGWRVRHRITLWLLYLEDPSGCMSRMDRQRLKRGNRKTGYKSPAIVHARGAVKGSGVLLGKVLRNDQTPGTF